MIVKDQEGEKEYLTLLTMDQNRNLYFRTLKAATPRCISSDKNNHLKAKISVLSSSAKMTKILIRYEKQWSESSRRKNQERE